MSESEDLSKVAETKAETESSPEIRLETKERIEFADRIVRGEYSESDADGLDPEVLFLKDILNENDPDLTPEELNFVRSWMERQLGTTIEESLIKARYNSADGETTFTIFDKELGDGWYLSRWQIGEGKPSFVFWPEYVYTWQEEAGYTEMTEQTS